MKNATAARSKITTAAIPTPIPAFAPVLRSSEELVAVSIGAEDEVVMELEVDVDAVPVEVDLDTGWVETASCP